MACGVCGDVGCLRGLVGVGAFTVHSHACVLLVNSAGTFALLRLVAIMRFHYALFPLFCVEFLSVSARLRRQGGGKEAEMEDVLKVAKGARRAAEIYVKEKQRVSKDQAVKDVYLVVDRLFLSMGVACH